jgi:hypothetical protein
MFTLSMNCHQSKVCDKLLHAQLLGCPSSASVDAAGCLEDWLLSKSLVVCHTVCVCVALWLAFFLHICVFCLHACLYITCMPGTLPDPLEFELPYGFWELNLGPLGAASALSHLSRLSLAS